MTGPAERRGRRSAERSLPAAEDRLPGGPAPARDVADAVCPPDGEPRDADQGRIWVLLPQALARLSALYVFAVAAHVLTAQELGVLAIATAAAGASFGLAPAVVGKPLAALQRADLRRDRGAMAQSFAVAASVAVATVLGVAAVVTDGLLRLLLSACAVGVPAAMVVESSYWRMVFVNGRRPAGLVLSACFAVQSAAVTGAALWLPASAVVLSPFVGLAAPAAVLLVLSRHVSLRGARAWATTYLRTWLPYVYGVAATVTLIQTIPVVLSLTAGLAAASVYRAGELLFGGTNLAIGVLTQALLTEDRHDVRAAFRRYGPVLAAVALANGVVIALLPDAVLRRLVGPVLELVRDVLPVMTVQRAALGVAVLGSILLVRLLSPRRIGALGVGSAMLNVSLLVVGATFGGLVGGLGALAAGETLVAAYYVWLVRRTR